MLTPTTPAAPRPLVAVALLLAVGGLWQVQVLTATNHYPTMTPLPDYTDLSRPINKYEAAAWERQQQRQQQRLARAVNSHSWNTVRAIRNQQQTAGQPGEPR